MILNRTEKVYPRQVIERIVGGQMRLVPEDGDLYENAVRNVLRGLRHCRAVHEPDPGAKRRDVRFRPLRVAARPADGPRVEYPVGEVLRRRRPRADARSVVLRAPRLGTDHRSRDLHAPDPLHRRQRARVRVEALCGYSDYRDTLTREPEDVGGIILPGNIEAAVALRAGTLCEVDGDAVIGRLVSELPSSVERLLAPYRISPYGR